MRFSPRTIGFVQAAGITIYVSVFGVLIQRVQRWFTDNHTQQHPILSTVFFLLTFIVSGLICGSIVFTKPLLLFFDGKKIEALKVVFWSLLWLVAFLIVLGIVATVFVVRRF